MNKNIIYGLVWFFVFIVMIVGLIGFHYCCHSVVEISIFASFWFASLFLFLKKRFRLSIVIAVTLVAGAMLTVISYHGFERVARSHYAPVVLPVYQYYYHVKTDKPCVALTFDDGPFGEQTEQILDVLAQHHAHATFFVQGHKLSQQRHIIERMQREHHEVANHSWDHPCLSRLSLPAVKEQIRKTNDAIRDITHQEHISLRPPFGQLTWLQGFLLCPEDVDSIICWGPHLDQATDAEQIINSVSNGSIILLHDQISSAEQVAHILEVLQKRGFSVVSASELIQMQEE